MKRGTKAISHLSGDMTGFYRHVLRVYRLSEHHRRLLVAACEAHDRASAARAQIEAEGLTTTNKHGETKPHPCVQIERDSAVRFARMLRELGLADEQPDNRPPRLTGRYAGRP